MSKRGNCYDNACAKSFFHSLEVGLTFGERYAMRQYLRQQVFEYIETYCNLVRRCHSALDYVSPVDFELNKVA